MADYSNLNLGQKIIMRDATDGIDKEVEIIAVGFCVRDGYAGKAAYAVITDKRYHKPYIPDDDIMDWNDPNLRLCRQGLDMILDSTIVIPKTEKCSQKAKIHILPIYPEKPAQQSETFIS